jgi:hypothetical protein
MGGLRGVAIIYLLYFLVSLLVFGVATAILARAWAPSHPWSAVLVVTVLAALTPWWLLGTGSPMLAIALPGVLGGFLVYLTAAALLTGAHRLAAGTAIATALVHVQQGAVVGVLLLMTVLVHGVRRRRVDWPLAVSMVVTFGIVAAILRARPVAGDINDFADACNNLIPYHCNATIWAVRDLIGGLGMVALALLTVVYLAREERFRWAIVLLLPAIGLISAVIVDRYNVPVLGVLAQGLNIYRLDVLLMPLAVWGGVIPLFARLTPRKRWQMLVVVLVVGFTATTQSSYAVPGWHGGVGMLMFAEAMVVVCVAATWSVLAGHLRVMVPIASVLIAVNLVAAGMTGDTLKLTGFHPGMFPKGQTRAWGEAVQRVVPPGSELVAPPVEAQIRMATKRAVVADCKYGPYGGPAWHEYSNRIEALGGFEQCRTGRVQRGYQHLSADELAATARKYDAGYIVLKGKDDRRRSGLEDEGWTEVQGAVGKLELYVYKAPWVS